MTAPDTDLQLLLSDAEGQAPVLAGGLPESALIGAQAPERAPRGQDSMHLEALDRDPNDLAAPVGPAPQPPAPANLPPTTTAEAPMSTSQAPPSAAPESAPAYPPQGHGPSPAPPPGAAPLAAMIRPRTLDNPEIGLRERAVLALIRGDEAPRSIAVRFGLPLEEIFYWLDVYREAGRRALGG